MYVFTFLYLTWHLPSSPACWFSIFVFSLQICRAYKEMMFLSRKNFLCQLNCPLELSSYVTSQCDASPAPADGGTAHPPVTSSIGPFQERNTSQPKVISAPLTSVRSSLERSQGRLTHQDCCTGWFMPAPGKRRVHWSIPVWLLLIRFQRSQPLDFRSYREGMMLSLPSPQELHNQSGTSWVDCWPARQMTDM